MLSNTKAISLQNNKETLIKMMNTHSENIESVFFRAYQRKLVHNSVQRCEKFVISFISRALLLQVLYVSHAQPIYADVMSVIKNSSNERFKLPA